MSEAYDNEVKRIGAEKSLADRMYDMGKQHATSATWFAAGDVISDLIDAEPAGAAQDALRKAWFAVRDAGRAARETRES